MPWVRRLFVGYGLALLQLCLLIVGQGRPDLGTAVDRLLQWDSLHYLRIAEEGYYWRFGRGPYDPRLTKEEVFEGTNAAFFPAYPFTVRTVQRLGNTSVQFALLASALLAAGAFWFLVLTLLSMWQVRPRLQLLCLAGIVAYPSSFYLSVGYSESLFLCLVLALLTVERSHSVAGTIAAWMIGFLLGLTRIVAIPAGLYSIAASACSLIAERRWDAIRIVRAVLIATGPILGVAAFFSYLFVAFGHADLYMHAQRVGWNVVPDPAALLRLHVMLLLPFRLLGADDPNALNKIAFAVFLWMTLIGVWMDVRLTRQRKSNGWAVRAPLYLTANAVAWLAAVAEVHNDFQSVVRYLLPAHVLLVLALVHLAHHTQGLTPRSSRAWWTASIVTIALSSLTALQAAWNFTHRIWVA